MADDLEFLRLLLLYLEDRQVSPRATVIIDVQSEAAALNCNGQDLEKSLNHLLELGYVEGPGRENGGIWLFRKLSRKGVEFVQAARDPKDWARLKQRYASPAIPF